MIKEFRHCQSVFNLYRQHGQEKTHILSRYAPLKLAVEKFQNRQKWDRRFLDIAEHVASWSKDPSTKVGAVIVRPDLTIASVGYNGFARYADDNPALYADRPTKLSRVIHAEMNAILNCHEPVKGYTLYTWPFMPCDRCAVHVAQAGIVRVVAPKPSLELSSRWLESLTNSKQVFRETGVKLTEIDE